MKDPDISITAIDLFCGAGGLTRGLLDSGLNVAVGVDIDEACKFPYEHNNGARFVKRDIAKLTGREVKEWYPDGHLKILVGCAPCQPFSKYTQGVDSTGDSKWGLLSSFGRLVKKVKPDVISMENVPELERHSVFTDFVKTLVRHDYQVTYSVVYCPDYGMPQHRSRLVLFASRLGPIDIIRPTHKPNEYRTVRAAIGELTAIKSGETDPYDPLHRSSSLSPLNMRRVRLSKPGGTWRDWPEELVAKCHREKTGKTYPGVYGRMEWDKPSPTITTQFFGFGNGRFGHPTQDRGLSLREGAILQTFPREYEFVAPGEEYCFKTIGRLIGNAVPVRLGRVVGKTIKQHAQQFA